MIKVAIHNSDSQGNVYTLLESISVVWNGKLLVVPEGFESDGASVPIFLWSSVFPPGDSKAMRAAIIHDYLYRNAPPNWTRKEADDLFYELLRADGVSWIRAQKAYWGVRLFGAWSWRAA